MDVELSDPGNRLRFADLVQAALGHIELALQGVRQGDWMSRRPETLRTRWHAADGTPESRARCGDAAALVVTDDPELVTCDACKAALAAEEEP